MQHSIGDVPQGYVLGPLLYILYTGQFQKCPIYFNIHMYIDDIKILNSFAIYFAEKFIFDDAKLLN